MKKNLLVLLITLCCFSFINLNYAQVIDISGPISKVDPVLLIVASDTVTKSEFLAVYNKNNIKKEAVIDKKSLEEYLQLYVNFKLKVKEAESLGMDTVSSFVTELAGYRKQLAQPYLINKDVNEKLLQEAYDRLQWDVRASHILIKVSTGASPEDTLAAYNKIVEIRNRALKGEDFGALAVENSEDVSARDMAATINRAAVKGNKGDLGYFTALDLIYAFETAAYTTKIGEISLPVRTDYGYHIIKVADKKPAMGKVQVAHILVTIPSNSGRDDSLKSKTKVKEIYDSIKAGSSFEDMAKKYSEDKASAAKGGTLPWFGIWRMLPDFVTVVSALKEKSDVSEPVLTMYGWHILKLISRKPVGAFDSIKTDLKTKIAKDTRASLSKEVMVESIKKEYGFKEDPSALADFYLVVNDSIFLGKWNVTKATGLEKVMFNLGNKQYTQPDFAIYLSKNLLSRVKEDSAAYVRKIYKQWVEASAIDYEDNRLESKYPEFKALMKEYRDGILLFELTDDKVWSKAVKDTVGLQAFYDKNIENYKWDERLDASVYFCANEKVAKATRKLVKKGKLINDEILKLINTDSQLNLKIETEKFEKKDTVIDSIPWIPGISKDIKRGNYMVFAKVKKVIPVGPKTISEARGLITADYQAFLEKEWIAELKKKYPVTINMDVFSAIK
ncbi:MAG: peptidylprolyl isomerase [Bacteroidota bacterium]